MKVKFSKVVKAYPNWGGNADLPEGERYYVVITPVGNLDILQLQAMLQEMKSGEDGNERAKSMMEICQKFLPDHVKLHNLIGEEGELTIDDVAKYPQFMDLAMELINRLIEVSNPTEQDEKNSGQPQG